MKKRTNLLHQTALIVSRPQRSKSSVGQKLMTAVGDNRTLKNGFSSAS
jgi:hypothetical protein